MFRTRFSFCDALAALGVLLVAVSLILVPVLFAQDGDLLQISAPSGTASYDLSEDREIELCENGIVLVIRIEDGAAFVSHSDCPDGICRASGRISRSGESILCAPAGVRVTVKGGADDVDFVAG